MMNIITNRVFRSLIACNPILQCPKFSRYSTDINAAPTEEPDKLYKTIELEMRAHEPTAMKSYSEFAKMAAEELGITVGKCWTPNKRIDREGLTVLRSRYVHKKHRTQYEVRTYFRFMTFHHLTGSTADTFLEYVERNLPEGMALKITKVALEKIPSEILTPPKFESEELEENDTNQNEK